MGKYHLDLYLGRFWLARLLTVNEDFLHFPRLIIGGQDLHEKTSPSCDPKLRQVAKHLRLPGFHLHCAGNQ